MPTYLDAILAAHRRSAAADSRDPDELVERARLQPPARPFAAALTGGDRLAVIAEIKRRSPSKGNLAPALSPSGLAGAYAEGGAAALSVLTDAEFFGGSAEDLVEARAAVPLPVLRKDFTVSPADVCDARLMGADAVLLIVAALSDAELVELGRLCSELGMAAVVEVHDEPEAERALSAGASVVGVNQRDLVTFDVDPDRAARVASVLPDTVIKVAESGVRHAEDAARLAAAGFHAVLVGESLVRSADPAAAVRSMAAAAVAPAARR